ncbi:ankyrin repeat domain-containing protein 34B-like isoform X2 [Melanotaenia boesemani]|uniref:ankyrin repeat domain-containing protein 34B-like isoform X2 n=1 Tax=Melanotaenia boesemani TaxID=1250792 RepID=UPI001C046DE7|nr:ankyrin repeat domain-containing protein 34B-like isoform X2 [Melanotaenia boesemani]
MHSTTPQFSAHPSQVLMDACKARGRDIIIIATEMSANGGLVTRRYLNVPPSPDTSPVSCMSPSDIVLKTGSPNSPEGENIFNFRGASKHGSSINRSRSDSRHPSSKLSPLSHCSISAPRKRVSSEPWLAIHNLACLNRAYEEGMRERSLKEEGDWQDLSKELHFQQSKDEESKEGMAQRRDNMYGGENYSSSSKDFSLRVSQLVPLITEMSSSRAKQSSAVHKTTLTTGGSTIEMKLPVCPSPYMQLRRNTLPSVTVVPPLPPLVNRSDSHLQASTAAPSKCRATAILPHPPSSSPPSSSSKASVRLTLLPPLALTSSTSSLVAPAAYSERSRRSLRRHSAQLEEIRGLHKNHEDF